MTQRLKAAFHSPPTDRAVRLRRVMTRLWVTDGLFCGLAGRGRRRGGPKRSTASVAERQRSVPGVHRPPIGPGGGLSLMW
jgi:hypothetical protein